MSRHVVVIGGGLVGLFTARFCRAAGWDVTMVGDGPMSSDGNAGMIVPSHFEPLAAPGMIGLGLRMMISRSSPLGISFFSDPGTLSWLWQFAKSANARHVQRASPVLAGLHLASRQHYVDLAKKFEFALVEGGLLMVCESAAQLAKEEHVGRLAEELGQVTRKLDRSDVETRFGTELPGVVGAIEFTQDAYLHPGRLIAALREDLEPAGVGFISSQVKEFKLETGQIRSVVTDQGEIAADEFVLAAGVGSRPLAQSLGLTMPMVAGKGYSFTFPGRGQGMTACALLAEARVAITPIGRDLRIAGTMELGSTDHLVNNRRVQGVQDSIHRVLPTWRDLRFEQAWVGHRPVPPDGVPYIGRTRFAKNLVIATGHGMMGVSLAPITGELVAGVLSGSAAPVPFDIMNPDRYAI